VEDARSLIARSLIADPASALSQQLHLVSMI
jgi:hypothetical protein